ncbi:MAG TPA: hypothetical protein DCL40_02225, partial [Coxiellaceae bacterium]|nr:hypothetical protein [Coxiellaceae bacterium]
MPTNDLELESVWLLAWAPFAGSSPRDVKYLAHYPHDRAKRALLLNKSLEMTSAIEEYRVADLKGNDRSVAAQRLSSQFVDSVLALFFQIAPLWVGMKVPLSPDCEDIMNLSIATNLVLIEGFFKPILSALNAMNNGLAKNFNSPDAVNNLDAIPLQDLKIELFNELKLLTLNHPYRSGVDRKRISDFLTLHAVPREGYPIDSVVGMFQCALKRIQLKYEKRDFITACSNILGKADVWQQKHHNFAFEEELKLLDEYQSDEVGQGKILSKSAQKKRRKKENKLRRIAEKENSQSIRILSASKIQRQIRFYLNTRESAARTLQQYIQSYLQRMQCHRENQAASIISHFIRHVRDTRIRDRSALLIHAFVAKAYYRQKNSLRQNQWWFDQLNKKTQHAALAIRDCIEECLPNYDLVLYGSRLLEGSSFGSYVVEDQSDLDLMMVLPSQINSSAFLTDVMFKLNDHAFESSGRLLNIFIPSEKKSIISCQFTAPFGCPSIDLTFVQYNEKSPHANISTLGYLSNNTLHADQFGLV